MRGTHRPAHPARHASARTSASHEPVHLTQAGPAQTPVLYLVELGVLMLASIAQSRLLPAPTQGSDADGMPRAKRRLLQPFVRMNLSELRTRCESRRATGLVRKGSRARRGHRDRLTSLAAPTDSRSVFTILIFRCGCGGGGGAFRPSAYPPARTHARMRSLEVTPVCVPLRCAATTTQRMPCSPTLTACASWTAS